MMNNMTQTGKDAAFRRKAVFVSVTEALSGKVPDIAPGMPLADIARGFWYVSGNKISQCELLVAVEKGIIRGVWEIDMGFGWQPMSANAIPTHNIQYLVVDPARQYCRVKGAVLPELNGKKLAAFGMRMYGPVRYNF